jgi:hypothetical protein
MSPAHHRHRFPILPRIAVLCALSASAFGYPSPIDFQPLSFHQLASCFFSNSFVFTNICVAPCYFPLRTLFVPPQCLPCPDLSALRVTRFLSIPLSSAACRLLALVFALPSFVFSNLQPLFQKHPGGGYFTSIFLHKSQIPDHGSRHLTPVPTPLMLPRRQSEEH